MTDKRVIYVEVAALLNTFFLMVICINGSQHCHSKFNSFRAILNFLVKLDFVNMHYQKFMKQIMLFMECHVTKTGSSDWLFRVMQAYVSQTLYIMFRCVWWTCRWLDIHISIFLLTIPTNPKKEEKEEKKLIFNSRLN